MKNTFFSRLLLTNTVAVFLVFAAIFAVEQFAIKRDAEMIVRERAQDYADNVSSRLKYTLKSMENLSLHLAASLCDIDPSDENAREEAESIAKSILYVSAPVYNAWFAFEPDAFDGQDRLHKSENYPSGRFIRSFVRNGVTREVFDLTEDAIDDPARSPWYTVPQETGGLYVGSITGHDYKDGKGPRQACGISWPVFRDGWAIGAAGMSVPYERICTFMDEIGGENGGMVLLFDSGGSVVYSPDRSLAGKTVFDFGFLRKEEIANAIQTGQPAASEEHSPFSGEYAIIRFQPVAVGGEYWSACVDVPYAQVTDAFASRMRSALSIAVLGLIALNIILFVISGTVTRPIKKMTDAVNEISNGNYEQVVEYAGNPNDEIGLFTAAINKMIAQLQQNALNLEQEVQVRTADLTRMKKKAEDAAAVKIQFLANMSHEIRTPMNVIIGMSELLLVEPLNERQRHLVSDIKTSASSLLEIVNDILDISRIEAGKLSLTPVDYDFPMLIENITSLIFFSVRSKGVYFFTELAHDMPRCLFGDPVRLRQVLVNVLGNAVKFTSEGYVKFAVAVTEGNIVFTVEDTGVGIRESEGANLFDVFEQAQSSFTRNIQGTGLGLSITRSLLDMMGGEISFTSVYGRGTTFTITIPKVLGNPDNIAVEEPDFVYIMAKDAEALVVDDNEVNLNVAAGLLRLCGVACDTALTARAALAKIKVKVYDLIFLDHMMPEMDGVEAAARIREMGGRFTEVPVIALTANVVDGAKEMFLRAGMNDFLSKPIDKAELNAILKKWLPESKIALGGSSPPSERPDGGGAALPEKLAWVRDVHELDISYALGRIEGMTDVYERGLKITARKIPEVSDKIRACLSEDNLKGYGVEVHGMKGGLAEIGALTLSHEAKELELAANKGDVAYCRANTECFLEKLAAFGGALTAGFDEHGDESGAPLEPGDGAWLRAALAEIHNALDDFAGDEALDTLNGLVAYTYGEETDTLLREMIHATEEYDYLKAMTLAKRIMNDEN